MMDNLGVPDDAGRVVLTDISVKRRQRLNPAGDPIDMHLFLALVVLQHSVGVKLSGVQHLLDVRCRCRRLNDDNRLSLK